MNYILQLFLKIPLVGLYAIGIVSIVSGDVFAKFWSKSHIQLHATASLIFYILGGLVFISIVAKSHSVGISNVIWNLAGIIGTLAFSYFLFSETISPLQFFGIVLGIVSIIFITY